MMSGRRSTLRIARKHKPTNRKAMFIETTYPKTLVGDVPCVKCEDQKPTVRRKLSEQQRDSTAHGPATVLANERSPALDLHRLLIGESDDDNCERCTRCDEEHKLGTFLSPQEPRLNFVSVAHRKDFRIHRRRKEQLKTIFK